MYAECDPDTAGSWKGSVAKKVVSFQSLKSAT
jgi:hypothetical protein